MKVAIYARVSTANNGQDPTMQTRETSRVCRAPRLDGLCRVRRYRCQRHERDSP